jgi:hypothetical protein
MNRVEQIMQLFRTCSRTERAEVCRRIAAENGEEVSPGLGLPAIPRVAAGGLGDDCVHRSLRPHLDHRETED